MSITAALLFVAAIIHMSCQVGAVKFFSSIDPKVLEVGKPVFLKWIVTYRDDALFKGTVLYLRKNLEEKYLAIANANDGRGLSVEGQRLLGGIAKTSVSINSTEVVVNFKSLEYSDVFHLMCLAQGSPSIGDPRKSNSTISVIEVKGGPSICGDSIIKDKYVLITGDSSFEVTMCGNPQPILSYTFDGKNVEVTGIEIDTAKRMYEYKIEMKNIDSIHCGKTIKFKASGFGTMAKESIIIVKYKPPKIKNFEYTKVIGENCTLFKVGVEYSNAKCPLKYEIQIYDKNKKIADFQNNPFTIDSTFYKTCRQDLFNKGKFAIVTAIWKHDLFQTELLGNPSKFIQVRNTISNTNSDNEKKITSISLTFLIPLVLGIVIIAMIIIIVLINKQKGRCCSTTTPRSEAKELMRTGQKEKTKGVQSLPTTNPEQYPLFEARLPEYYVLEESKPPPLYSELGDGGGRAGPKPVLKPESNYADAKDVDYPDNKHSVYPEKYQKQKDMFDPVDSSDSDDCNQGVSPGKVFKPLFGDESRNVSRQKCASTNQDQEISASGIYPKGYNINKGLPVYLDSNASIANNPPKVAFYERKTAPGMPKLPPVAYPKFDRSDNV